MSGFASVIAAQSGNNNSLFLKGDIGGYKVEMEISSSVFDSATFEGRYKYKSQENYLKLKGNNYGSCIYIEEYYNGETTGSFYLERAGDTLTGHWLNETKVFPVLLVISSGNRELLTYKTLEDYNAEVNDKIAGTYQISYSYINDYFVSEESPFAYEIGFNGGFIIFEEVGADSLKFELELICGPTYHFAMAEGIAVKQGDVFVYSEDPYEWGESCNIVFKFGYKTVSAEAENSQSCGFGARAYVDHELIKVAD
jgi:hypothetical protein